MNSKRIQMATDIARPHLTWGEEIEIISFAAVGAVSLGRQVAVTATVAMVSGGTLLMIVRPRRLYIVMTSQRLLMFEPGMVTGRPTKQLVGAVHRASVMGVTEPRRGVTTRFDLMLAGQDKALRMTFPRPTRDDGLRIATALAGR